MQLCRVVLVGTQFPGNIGATARAMRNFGLEDLHLVAPACDPLDRQARAMATRGEAILERAPVVATLEEAVADCVFVAGTTARTGGLFRRQPLGRPEEIMAQAADALRGGRHVALVFGNETNGLSHEQATLCHALIHIPTSADYAALNLAQAVAVCLYELHRALHPRAGPVEEDQDWRDVAPFAEQQAMLTRLEAALTGLHFLYGDKAAPLMHALRHLLGKARLTSVEVRILDGLARQIAWQNAGRAESDEGA